MRCRFKWKRTFTNTLSASWAIETKFRKTLHPHILPRFGYGEDIEIILPEEYAPRMNGKEAKHFMKMGSHYNRHPDINGAIFWVHIRWSNSLLTL